MTENSGTKKTKPTMMDVAARANVSVATVSNTINNTRRVDEGTRARVERAIEELGYIRNMSARRFRTGRTNMLAVLTSMPSAVANNPSHLGMNVEIAAAAAGTAMKKGTSLVLVPPTNDPLATLGAIDIDGALLIEPAKDDPFLQLLQQRDVPFVCIGEPSDTSLPYVDLNYDLVAELLVSHMQESDAIPFALLCGQAEKRSYSKMVSAYEMAAEKLGMPSIVRKLDEQNGADGARACTHELLRDYPNLRGILAPIDAYATGVMAALADAKRLVPQDIKVATRYDGPRARESSPQLTAIDLHLSEVARIAVEMLMAIVGDEAVTAESPPKPTVIARGSTTSETPAHRLRTG